MTEISQPILSSFLSAYGGKYGQVRPLGQGARGVTFRAIETASGADVVIKLPHVPLDVPKQRDFRISRLAPSAQYADLFTVEPFKHHGATAYAVVTRYISGLVWEQFVERLNAPRESASWHQVPKLRLARIVLDTCNSLVSAVSLFHAKHIAHGDVHERNAIVREAAIGPRMSFEVILIDLGNASFLTMQPGKDEDSLIAFDVRSVGRMLRTVSSHMPYTSYFNDAVRFSESTTDLLHLMGEYDRLLKTLDRVAAPDQQYYYDELRHFLAMQVSGQPPWRIRFRQFLSDLAQETSSVQALADAEAHLLDRIKNDPDYPQVEFSGETISVEEEKALQQLTALGPENGIK
ncbi:hypothetical protein WMF45_42875 [Sorangium sp. So ce448]|uniref:hypothetical protein n=1 Tax=Sorangium sp. So ce448 TaxID=3133314 RepID=UPI003F5FB73C